jgi:hypothetical protein
MLGPIILLLASLVAFALGGFTSFEPAQNISTPTVFDQRANNNHASTGVGFTKSAFPKIKLAKKARQKEAVDLLGDRLPEVASWYDLSASEFEKILLSDKTAWLDESAQLFYVEEAASSSDVLAGVESPTTSAIDTAPVYATGVLPNEQTFFLHSSPNSKKVIYLDFDGGLVSLFGYSTNHLTTPFDMDGNPEFSTSELQAIQNIWQRVAEDYVPFDIDVTTEALSDDRIYRASSTDEYFGIRVVITPSGSVGYCGGTSGCGGVSYVGAMGRVPDYLQPALVFPNNLSYNPQYIALAVSHEAGHTIGQVHDGTFTYPYYTGHGAGTTSWGPIMGSPYTKTLTQLSKGEYPNANNKYDDILYNLSRSLGYYPDDTGNTISDAKPMSVNDTFLTAYGVIEQAVDVDIYSFEIAGGNLTLTASPALFGPNLDIKMELLDSAGNVIASSNPDIEIKATIIKTLPAGTYYVTIDGVGKLATSTDPGYSDYASLGQYKIFGALSPNSTQPPTTNTITAPSNLTTTASNKVVTLKWLDKSNNEEGFYVERALNSKKPSYQRVAEVSANTTQLSETVTPATYIYRIQAFNKTTGSASPYSNTSTVKVR